MKDKIMFVRTKDNRIIEVENEKHLCSDNEYRFQYKDSPALIKQSNVVKSSDKLEDLFDEVVLDNSINKPLISPLWEDENHRELAKKIFIDSLKVDIKVYGAIWTEKGLIYVAKMTDKGEWELC